jgi:hypothetical protein
MNTIDQIDLERVYRRLKRRYTSCGPYMMPGNFLNILDGIDSDHANIEAECKQRGWIRDDDSRTMANGESVKAYFILPGIILKPMKSDQINRGKAGRRGYPKKAKDYAKNLRAKHPDMTAKEIRRECLKKFSDLDLPPDAGAFRRWLNR